MTGISSFICSKSVAPIYNKLHPKSTARVTTGKVHLKPITLSNHHLHHGTVSPVLSSATKPFATSSFSGFDHENLPPVIASVGIPLAKFIGVWALWPWMLRKFHGYLLEKNPWLALGGEFEDSFWGALEVSYRSYVTFMEILNSIVAIAPSLVARRYIQPVAVGRGVVICSFLVFIHQLKSSIIKHFSLGTNEDYQRENLLTLDKILSVALFGLGVLTMCEAFEFSLKATLICWAIGIAALVNTFVHEENRDNILSLPSEDMTKIGTVEGKVTEMESSAAVNQSAAAVMPSAATLIPSRGGWSAMKSEIYVYSGYSDKIFEICQEIYEMMKADPNVFLGREPPRCYPCHVNNNLSVLAVMCNTKSPSEHSINPKQVIVNQAIAIIEKHGAPLSPN